MKKIAPLSKGFMLVSILGFIAVVVFWSSLGETWGFTLGVLFLVMFISSMISMTYGPSAAEMEIDKMKIVPSRAARMKTKSKKAKKRSTKSKKSAKKRKKTKKRQKRVNKKNSKKKSAKRKKSAKKKKAKKKKTKKRKR